LEQRLAQHDRRDLDRFARLGHLRQLDLRAVAGDDVDRLPRVGRILGRQPQRLKPHGRRELVIEIGERQLRVEVSLGDKLNLPRDPRLDRPRPRASRKPKDDGPRENKHADQRQRNPHQALSHFNPSTTFTSAGWIGRMSNNRQVASL
jgi:hypothetical protein